MKYEKSRAIHSRREHLQLASSVEANSPSARSKIMKSSITLVIVLALGWSCAFAARDNADDLVSELEKAVVDASQGDIAAAVRRLNAEARTPKGPKEVGAQTDNFRNLYAKLAGLGEPDEVERLSLRYSGDSFFRLRVIDKRAEGVILWTFVGYKYKGSWACKGVSFNGGDDLMQIMRQELDAADAK